MDSSTPGKAAEVSAQFFKTWNTCVAMPRDSLPASTLILNILGLSEIWEPGLECAKNLGKI